jgi:HD-GYP domain-containing protein (c-di-GMP phosphodiesterase class II)
VPLEIIGLIDRKMYTAQDAFLLEDIYRNLCAYIFHMPNTGGLSYFMEYYEAIIRDYIEIPSGLSFMDFMLQCLAALHPPTYIHSVMVGRLSECMCRHLIESRPDLFIGVLGCGSASEVRERAADIIAFTYNAAICHDFGKVNIFDTIFVYGRRLLDFEFNIIKSHPEMGYDLLSAHASTRAYAPVALGHHRWYDDSKGYPESFNTSGSDIKVIIDLVQCADCMDAATDSVGRSYNRGKRLSDFLQELSEGAGTRYAPWLVDLFDSRELRSDIEYLLTGGRARQYRETYNLLKDVQDNG